MGAEAAGKQDAQDESQYQYRVRLLESIQIDEIWLPLVIKIPKDQVPFYWGCMMAGCESRRVISNELCRTHRQQFMANEEYDSELTFARNVADPRFGMRMQEAPCRICEVRPTHSRHSELCERHKWIWRRSKEYPLGKAGQREWLHQQEPLPSFGECAVPRCEASAANPIGLCGAHTKAYERDGNSKEVGLEYGWKQRDAAGEVHRLRPVDVPRVMAWSQVAKPIFWNGTLNTIGLPRLMGLEIRYTIQSRMQDRDAARWDLTSVEKLIEYAIERNLQSFIDLRSGFNQVRLLNGRDKRLQAIARQVVWYLEPLYLTEEDAKSKGILYFKHFEYDVPGMRGYVDLRSVGQTWLRDVTWESLKDSIEGANPPRNRSTFDAIRRSIIELGAYLERSAEEGGREPSVLGQRDAKGFAREYSFRLSKGLPSTVLTTGYGTPAVVTENTRRFVYSGIRRVLRFACDSGLDHELGIPREFILAFPQAHSKNEIRRRPLSDEAHRAVCDPSNLLLLEGMDPTKGGVRDVWETLMFTGRRASEALELRLDCLTVSNGMNLLHFRETKVGIGESIVPIPDQLRLRLEKRQEISRTMIEAKLGRKLTSEDLKRVALFPSRVRNPTCEKSISYGQYLTKFREWTQGMKIGHVVSHQARHTIATQLLRSGASTAHIKHYLGHTSERMTEHYVHVVNEDLERVLQQVWVEGPGASTPGAALPQSRDSLGRAGKSGPNENHGKSATMIDLLRASSPTQGGVCTFQPVVRGAECPWSLDCEGCKHFVLTGADLNYWRRKQEQWRILAENAPDESVRDYMHAIWKPMGEALKGLEGALLERSLLQEAENLDLRRPQDFFRPLWNYGYKIEGRGNDRD